MAGESTGMDATRKRIPRDPEDDYTREAARERGRLRARSTTGAELEHVSSYSFDPAILPGNVENFTGVAQVPIGFAGPLLVNGEHAQGEFYVPLATAEGTLVASYNRGMKLLHEAGGVMSTVIDDACSARRCSSSTTPARRATSSTGWTRTSTTIRRAAEATTRSGKLQRHRPVLGEPDPLPALQLHHRRRRRPEPHRQGDARGLRLDHGELRPGIEHFFLESNFATDKKSSQVNILRTRGKRVMAEATIPRDLIQNHARRPRGCSAHARSSNLGGFMSGVNNNGAHSANGITAMFIATGQDVANVAESSAAFVYTEVPPNGDSTLDHHPVADRRHLRRRHRPGRPSASASSCSAATARARSRSWPRSSPRPCSAASSRSARRSSPRSGWRRTTCTAATGRRGRATIIPLWQMP